MSSISGYTDLTPSGGFLQGNSRPLKFTLLDASSNGVAGEQSNITLYIVEPSGSVTVPGASLTDNGDGSYQYVHEFNEAGWNKWDFTFESGTTKLVVGGMINVNQRTTSTAQV